MDSDEDFEQLPSSPVIERKLKRLKKASRVSEIPRPSSPPINFPEFENDAELEESNGGSVPEIENLDGKNVADTLEEDDLGAKRVLEFDSVDDELDGDGNVSEKTTEEFGDKKSDELEIKEHSVEDVSEKKDNKKKKKRRNNDGDGSEKKLKETTSNKRKAEKERQEHLKQLRAESQRLLRETRDAAFKPVPLVQKPISSILDKIRKRKLEFIKKSNVYFDDNDGNDEFPVDIVFEAPCVDEEITDKIENAELEETPAVTENNLSTPHIGGSNDAADHSSHENIPSPMDVGSDSVHAFRAPVDDTQDLFSDSEINDIKEEAIKEKLNKPSEEVFAPSLLSMNLKLDSAPYDISSDDEDNDRENKASDLHRSADLTLSPGGDPVKAFVEEEAEEEDDSDNDLQRFQDNEDGEDDDDDDIDELNDMIATGYEEEPIDREKRDQLHQQWLEQQDTTGMDNLLQKLNCGSRLKESTSIEIEDEDEESKETDNESDDEVEDFIAPSDTVKINLKKLKQMIPQMFTDKDEAYKSSDEETEERLARQSHSHRVEKKAQFISPAEDESSKEVFSLIKKSNIVTDTKRKARTPSIFEMPCIGQNTSISSKSSFLNRASKHSVPSQKHGPSKVRSSFIFGRDDSNSRTSESMTEDSSDTIVRESQAPKVFSAKFQRSTQNKYATSNSKSQESNVSLLEVLKKSSLHTKRSVQNAGVQQNKSVFEAFKLTKKSIKTGERV